MLIATRVALCDDNDSTCCCVEERKNTYIFEIKNDMIFFLPLQSMWQYREKNRNEDKYIQIDVED